MLLIPQRSLVLGRIDGGIAWKRAVSLKIWGNGRREGARRPSCARGVDGNLDGHVMN